MNILITGIVSVRKQVGTVSAAFVDKGDLCINPFAEVNPVGVVLGGPEHDLIRGEISGVKVDMPLSLCGQLLLEVIGEELYACKGFRIDQIPEKNECPCEG